MNFARDSKNYPVMLADVPGSGVVKQSDAKSGNPNHDTKSGKFGSGGGGGERKNPNPPNAAVDPNELQRMLSAVRDAAREFDNLNQGDIRDFLKGRAADPSVVDIDKFMQMVQQQRLQDLSDILDQQFRTSGEDAPGKRKVKITAPRGFLRKALRGLNDDNVKQLVDILVSRGHQQDEVVSFFQSKGFETVQFSDEYDTDDFIEMERRLTAPLAPALEAIASKMAAEDQPRTVTKTFKRDEHGLIESVTETPVV